MRAAFERVAEIGFEGLRLRQVAEQVGIDHSTLHHHFATKQALVAAVAEYTTRQFWADRAERRDPAAALRAHLAALQQLMTERPELFAVSAELDLRARRDPDGGRRAGRPRAGLAGAARRAAPTGRPDPHAAAELVIATVKGVRLAPERAGPVFDRLAALLTEPRRRRAMNVIIVGGGIGGLALAQGLRRAGVPVAGVRAGHRRRQPLGGLPDPHQPGRRPGAARLPARRRPGRSSWPPPGRAATSASSPTGSTSCVVIEESIMYPGGAAPDAGPLRGRSGHAAAHADHRAG